MGRAPVVRSSSERRLGDGRDLAALGPVQRQFAALPRVGRLIARRSAAARLTRAEARSSRRGSHLGKGILLGGVASGSPGRESGGMSPDPDGSVRLAELVATLSLATDLGTGQPTEAALRTCWLSIAIGQQMGLAPSDLADVYYVALLRHVGCTADAYEAAAFAGGDDLSFWRAISPFAMGEIDEVFGALAPYLSSAGVQPRLTAQSAAGVRRTATAFTLAHCEVAEMLAARVGLGPEVCKGLRQSFERWDGQGVPHGVAGEEIAIAARVATVARDAELWARIGGISAARELVDRRRGRAYDPDVADAFLDAGSGALTETEGESLWDAVVAAEPGNRRSVPESQLDERLTAFAAFADLKSPFTHMHSIGVASLGESTATAMGLDQARVVALRRAALVHDLGRTGVPNSIWDKPGRLSGAEWERVRLHPYFTERMIVRCGALAALAPLAGSHHERLDGSGYHRCSPRAALSVESRILAAADAFQAMTQPRPHRPPLTAADAARHLLAEADSGRLDRAAVQAMTLAAGEPVHAPRQWPAGLSNREVEILRLLCQGRANREVADCLGISAKTVGHHVAHIYTKVGVSTRASLAVYAMENDLLEPGIALK